MDSVLSSPAQSSPLALTDAGASTPADGPASPSTPSRQPLQPVVQSAQNTSLADAQASSVTPVKMTLTTGQGPPKRQKKQKQLTPAEQAEKDKAEAIKKEKMEARRQAKEQKRVEQEKKRIEQEKKKEEAEKKARSQQKIGSFFGKKDTPAPKAANASVAEAAVKAKSPPPAAVLSDYDKLAQPFFVHQSVKLAKSAFAMDEETREAKTNILTDYLAGKRSPVSTKPFNPVNTLGLGNTPVPRGKSYPRVKDLMGDQDSGMSNPIDLIAESLSLPTRQSLKGIPIKQLSFHEDVRPGYYGTITSVQSVATLKKMAKHPVAKDLPLNYDYDSEAEWVQGDEEEDAEGLDEMSDDDDDEEDAKSLDEFLDDSDDVRRGPLVSMSTMEPETSGICFEDRTRRNPNLQLYKFRMEFLVRTYLLPCLWLYTWFVINRQIANLEHHHSIDPFSSAYWPSDTKTATSTAQPADNSPNGVMRPPPAPKATNGPVATASAAAAVATKNKPDPADLVPASQLEDFKATIVEFKFLPKSALVPTLKKKFDGCTSGQIKATLDLVAEKPQKRGDWMLKEKV